MDNNLQKLIEATQPESLSTVRLCKRLGYRPEDLIFKSPEEFQAVNEELRLVKYEHYKQRVLKIINEINNVRSRHKTLALSELPSLTNVQQFSAVTERTEVEQERGVSVKEKVLQNLIYQELLRQKKFAEYYQQKKSPVTISKLKPDSKQPSKTQVSEKCIKPQFHQSFQQTFNDEIKLKPSTTCDSERFLIKRSKILQEEEKQQEEQLLKLQAKERKAMERIQQLKTQSSMRKSYTKDTLQKREQLETEQYQQMITKYCEKLLNFKKKETLIKQPIRNQIQIRSKTKSLAYNDILEQQINEKIEKVSNLRSEILITRSKIAREKLKISQEDVNFNKYHNEQIKRRDEQKLIGKLCKTERQLNNYDLKIKVREKQRNDQIWAQVNKVGHLFSSPLEFEKYRSQMKLLLNKQRESLDPKYQSKIDILYQLLPQQLAEQVLQ